MPEDAISDSQESFDLEKLRELIELMEKHDLTEVDLRQKHERWQLRRGGPAVPMMPVPQMPAAAPAPAAPQPSAAAPAPAAEEAAPPDNSTYIKSPTVGTFYTAPSPDDPDFVKVGSVVSPDTIVCIVEAMKVFNQIPAETSGKIAELLVSNGDPVEFNQPLFRVQPA